MGLINKKNALYWILGLSISLRLCIALMRTDMVWPDEHFQTLEPAGHAVFGFGLLSWEWLKEYRSWIGPGFFVPLFYFLKLLGVTGGMIPVYAARVMLAIFSGLLVLPLSKICDDLKINSTSKWIALGLFAIHPSLLLWGPTTLSDTIITFIYWSLLAYSIGKLNRPILIGFLMSIPFLFKIQSLVFTLTFIAILFVKSKSIQNLAKHLAGVLLAFLVYGLVDFFTYGTFLKSFINQVTQGLAISKSYGTSPFYDYFLKLTTDQGLFIVLFLIFSVVYLLKKKKIKINFNAALIYLPPMAYFVFLSFIVHKEMRFLLPVLPMLYIAIAHCLHFLINERLKKSLHRFSFFYIVVFIGLSIYSVYAASKIPLYLSSVKIDHLEDVIYKDGGLSNGNCIFFHKHNWSWSRGYLVLGQETSFVTKSLDPHKLEIAQFCPYAILPSETLSNWYKKYPKDKWKIFAQEQTNSYILLKFTPTP